MVFLENPPTYDRLAEEFAWEKTYAAEKQRRRREEPVLSWISGIVKWMRLNLRRPHIVKTTLRHLRDLRRTMPGEEALRFLDVGCGDGKKTVQIPELMQQRGEEPVRPVGIEVSTAQAVEAQERFSAFEGECIAKAALDGMAEIEDRSIHLIVLLSFLEHEVQPVNLLKACGSKLVPGGRVIIKVPNFASWNRRIRRERWCGFRYPDHVNYFTPETLTRAVEAAGLRVRKPGWRDRLPTSDNMWFVVERPAET